MNPRPTVKDLDYRKLLVAPSILSADFAALGADVERVEKAGCELLHIDVMDGHFVPNLTIGPVVVSSIRKNSGLVFDTHLMISNPLKYIESFAKAGSDHITFHLESDNDPDEVIAAIRKAGCSVGISLKPKTPAAEIIPFIEKVDLILVMTVEPGFGGQSFMPDMMPKVREIRDAIERSGRPVHLQVDGGIAADTVAEAAGAGANNMVAGSSVFCNPAGVEKAIADIHAGQRYLTF